MKGDLDNATPGAMESAESMEWRGGNHIVPVDFRDDLPEEPDDYYEQYSEWLCNQADLHICNGDDLVRHFEAATRFDEYLMQRNGK